MTATRLAPARVPGAPCATTVVIVDLLPGTHSYCDLHKNAQPILVVDTGPTELQMSFPGDVITVADLQLIDSIMEALAVQRTALVAHIR